MSNTLEQRLQAVKAYVQGKGYRNYITAFKVVGADFTHEAAEIKEYWAGRKIPQSRKWIVEMMESAIERMNMQPIER